MKLSKNSTDIGTIFKVALDSFIDKVKQDEQVIAVILLGSLSYDQVWEKSDIDLKLIVHEQKLVTRSICFIENDIVINASIYTRNDFKRWVESMIQSAFDHSVLVRSTLLFAKDESIQEYYVNMKYVGDRDRQLRLLQLGCYMLVSLAKAEKWYLVKQDSTYSAFWLIKLVDLLAQIEVIMNGEVPMREVVQQALAINPEFFRQVYSDMICGAVGEKKVRCILELVDRYMEDRTVTLFKPILDYLRQEQDFRTLTDIMEKLGAAIDLEAGSLVLACDWLADRNFVLKAPMEAKATPKSRVKLDEPAYLFKNIEDISVGV